MNIDIVKKDTIDIVAELFPDLEPFSISSNDDIFSMGLDSVNAMTLVMNVQSHFELMFDENDISLENFRTVDSIVALILSKKTD